MFYVNEPYITNLHRGVEQLVARRAHNPKVAGSNPVPATTKSPLFEGFFIWGTT
jgi:hypothetical protein